MAHPAVPDAPAVRPNVLFIAVDDLRPELGCYGHPIIQSPHIDRIAREGMLFTRAYCQQAICAPSRASLLSGCRPDTTGIYDLGTPLVRARPDLRTLPQHFRKNGYRTVSLGKIYHHGNDDPAGWDERPRVGRDLYHSGEIREYRKKRLAEADRLGYRGPRRYNHAAGPSTECLDVPDAAYSDGAITDEALRQLNRHRNRPFFLAVGFWKPHLPFTAPRRYWDLYRRDQIPLPDKTEPKDAPRIAFSNWGELRAYRDIPKRGDLDAATTRKLIHGYFACVSYIDAQVGRLLGELDRLGLREKTIIILWGDHGWKLGEYGDWCKHTNFELDTRVPLILSVPGVPAGRKCRRLVEFVDIYPTLAELCGLEIPPHCEGTSMAPLLEDPERPWKTAAFSQYPRGRVMGYSLRTERWRYNEWIHRETGRVAARELYDHARGPFTGANLAGRPGQEELVKKLSRMMKAGWRGAVPGPDGSGSSRAGGKPGMQPYQIDPVKMANQAACALMFHPRHVQPARSGKVLCRGGSHP